MSQSSRTNILLEVTSLSMRIGRKYVAPYSHRFSPQKFTQEQLLTCLILRAYLKTTYRGVIEFLEVSDALRDRLGLKTLPHYSTLKKFTDRSSRQEEFAKCADSVSELRFPATTAMRSRDREMARGPLTLIQRR